MQKSSGLAPVPLYKRVELDHTLVQNTWFTILEVNNVEVSLIAVEMQTANEDLEFKITVDGEESTGSQAGAVAGTPYYIHTYIASNAIQALFSTTQYLPVNRYAMLKGRSVKLEVRKTSATGANKLNYYVEYGQW